MNDPKGWTVKVKMAGRNFWTEAWSETREDAEKWLTFQACGYKIESVTWTEETEADYLARR